MLRPGSRNDDTMAIMRSRGGAQDSSMTLNSRRATEPALHLNGVIYPVALPIRRPVTTTPSIVYPRPLWAAADEGIQRSRMLLQSSQRARDIWAPRSRRHVVTAGTTATGNRATTDEERARHHYAAMQQQQQRRAALRSRTVVSSPPVPLMSGFERLFADVGFNVLNLDELIGAASWRITDTSFSHGPSNLRSVIMQRESYFSHLPARYGSGTSCLDDALRCIAVKVKRVLSPEAYLGDAGDAGLYGKALRSLQSAITGESWSDPNVLCAAELISVYELLEGPSRLTAWSQHLSGSARLIRSRGPSGFKADFDKALFIAMLGSIVSEAWTSGTPCFLNEDPWQEFLQDLMHPDSGLSLRTRNYIWLGSLGAKLTMAWTKMDTVMDDPSAAAASDIHDLEQLCRAIKVEAHSWRHQYDDHLAGSSSSSQQESTTGTTTDSDTEPWIEVKSAGCSLQAVICRLLGAMSASDRVAEEHEALAHSTTMVRLLSNAVSEASSSSTAAQQGQSQGQDQQTNSGGSGTTASLYMSQKGAIGQSIFATTHLWLNEQQDYYCDPGTKLGSGGETASKPGNGLIDGDVYRTWRDLISPVGG